MKRSRFPIVQLIILVSLILGSSLFAVPSVFSQDHSDPQDPMPGETAMLPLTQIAYTHEVYCPTPQLVSPHNNSAIDTLVPLFEWDDNDNGNVDAVIVEVYSDPSFANQYYVMLLVSYPGGNEFRFNFNFKANKTYYWRAHNVCNGYEGPFSTAWSFTPTSGGSKPAAPVLLAPANNSRLDSFTTTFDWEDVVGAVEYCVSWTYSNEWTGWNWEPISELYVWGLEPPNTTWWWWVTARNEYALGADSPNWFFTTPAQALTHLARIRGPYVIVEEADGMTQYRMEKGLAGD